MEREAPEKGRPGKGLWMGTCLGHKGAKTASPPAAASPGSRPWRRQTVTGDRPSRDAWSVVRDSACTWGK